MKKSRVIRLDEYHGQPVTQRSAIRLKCLDCCGNQRNEVRLCEAYHCPLWPYRLSTGYQAPPHFSNKAT